MQNNVTILFMYLFKNKQVYSPIRARSRGG